MKQSLNLYKLPSHCSFFSRSCEMSLVFISTGNLPRLFWIFLFISFNIEVFCLRFENSHGSLSSLPLESLSNINGATQHKWDPKNSVEFNGPYLNVLDFGAKPDGVTDNTDSFVAALKQAGSMHGTIVFVPSGVYLINGTLSIPASTALQGVNVVRSRQLGGTRLLTVHGKGNEEDTPFISLGTDAGVISLEIFYPEQNFPPIPYPWTIRGLSDDATVIDVTIFNPWKAVDLGTITGGRHFVRGLYAQPLQIGLYIDNTFDVGRVEDVHFWPFWSADQKVLNYTANHVTAFLIGRTDWEYMVNCFSISHRIGYHFIAGKNGPGNAVLVNSGADEPGLSVLIENSQSHAGISFVNGQFMGGANITDTNEGPVKFTNCGFWGVHRITNTHLYASGKGTIFLLGSHFTQWAQVNSTSPAIVTRGKDASIIVQGCDFMDTEHPQISLESSIEAAIITGNRCRGGVKIENNVGDHAVIASNLGY